MYAVYVQYSERCYNECLDKLHALVYTSLLNVIVILLTRGSVEQKKNIEYSRSRVKDQLRVFDVCRFFLGKLLLSLMENMRSNSRELLIYRP